MTTSIKKHNPQHSVSVSGDFFLIIRWISSKKDYCPNKQKHTNPLPLTYSMANPNLTSTPSPIPSNEEIIKKILGRFSTSQEILYSGYYANNTVLSKIQWIDEKSTIVDTIIALVGEIERLNKNSTTDQQEQTISSSKSWENFHDTNKSTNLILVLDQMIRKIKKKYNIPENINKTLQRGTSVDDVIHSTSEINEMMKLIEKLITQIMAKSELLSPVVEKSAAIVAETLEQWERKEVFEGFYCTKTSDTWPASGEFVWIASGETTTLPRIYQDLLKILFYKMDKWKKRPELEQITKGESQIKHRSRITFSEKTYAIQLPATHQEDYENKFLTHYKDTETNKSHYILSTLDTKWWEDHDERQWMFFAFAANHDKRWIPKKAAWTLHEEPWLTHQYFASIDELKTYLIAILTASNEGKDEEDRSSIIL